MLNEQERKKYTTIEKLENGEITRKEASDELKVSLRQIDRLRITFHSYGEQGFIHKNRGKENPNKKKDELIEEYRLKQEVKKYQLALTRLAGQKTVKDLNVAQFDFTFQNVNPDDLNYEKKMLDVSTTDINKETKK